MQFAANANLQDGLIKDDLQNMAVELKTLKAFSGNSLIQETHMAKLVHSMIRVFNEEKSVQFYHQAFGLETVHRLDFDSFILVYLRNDENDFELELTINKDRTQPYDLGDGYGHIAVVVDDLEKEHQRLIALGLEPRPVVDFKNGAETVARFFFIADPDGYKIEVIERGGHYR